MTFDTEPTAIDPVGVAHTAYETTEDAPHRKFADDAEAPVEIFEPYTAALAVIEEYHRLTVVYWPDRADRDALIDGNGIGAFAKRTPHRPNPLSICSCLLLDRTDRKLRVRGLDALDGSPAVDLEPALQAERGPGPTPFGAAESLTRSTTCGKIWHNSGVATAVRRRPRGPRCHRTTRPCVTAR